MAQNGVGTDLCIDTTRQQQVLLDRVEVEATDRASVLVALEHQGLLTSDDLDGVVNDNLASLHAGGNHAAAAGSSTRLRPCETVEAEVSCQPARTAKQTTGHQ